MTRQFANDLDGARDAHGHFDNGDAALADRFRGKQGVLGGRHAYRQAGNGYGNELDFEKPSRYKGSLFSYYIDPHPSVLLPGEPTGPQYNLRGYLWQQVSSTTQLQANANLRQNISFNTQYFSQDPNQSQSDVLSSVALTQQTRTYNQHLVVQREDAPDSSGSGAFQTTHMQNASIPSYNFTLYQRPLWSPKSSMRSEEHT